MKRFFGLLTLAVVVLVAFAAYSPTVSASSPHFIAHSLKASLSGSSLNVSFKEAGLGSGTTVTISVSATASETDLCVNNGGHNPSAANKRTVESTVSNSGTFTAGKNGNVVGSLTVTAPGTGLACPPGQELVAPAKIVYSDIVLTDQTSGISATIPGAVCGVFTKAGGLNC